MLAKLPTSFPGRSVSLRTEMGRFRAIVFRGGSDVFIQSRDLRPLDRYFPELHQLFLDRLPPGCVLDGEIVIPGARVSISMRCSFGCIRRLPVSPSWRRRCRGVRRVRHPCERWPRRARVDASRPSRGAGVAARACRSAAALTPVTRDRALAADWLNRFEGAGLDGSLRSRRTARTSEQARDDQDQTCAHGRLRRCRFPLAQERPGHRRIAAPRSIRRQGDAHHVGVTSSFTMATRKQLARDLEPLRTNALDGHPWREWAVAGAELGRMPGGQSRWSAGKDMSWEPLRLERVCEIKTVTCKAIASGTRRCSRWRRTSRCRTAGTISSRSRRLTSSRRSSGRAAASHELLPTLRRIVRIERLLGGTQLLRHVLKVDGCGSYGIVRAWHRPAHRMPSDLQRPQDDGLSSARARERIVLCGAANLEEWMVRHAAVTAARARARRPVSCSAAAMGHRLALALLACRQLEQRLERTRPVIDPA